MEHPNAENTNQDYKNTSTFLETSEQASLLRTRKRKEVGVLSMDIASLEGKHDGLKQAGKGAKKRK